MKQLLSMARMKAVSFTAVKPLENPQENQWIEQQQQQQQQCEFTKKIIGDVSSECEFTSGKISNQSRKLTMKLD